MCRFAAKSGPPVVRLNRSELVQQIRLLNTGLLGKGSTALVFKGLWPSRFGPDAVLAIKVLKDPYESDPSAFEGFTYEVGSFHDKCRWSSRSVFMLCLCCAYMSTVI